MLKHLLQLGQMYMHHPIHSYQHLKHILLLQRYNAEEAKCASGAGNYVWGGACTSDPAEASVLTYFNTTLGMKNPYATASDALVSHTAATWNTSNANGSVQVYHNDTTDQWTIIADMSAIIVH